MTRRSFASSAATDAPAMPAPMTMMSNDCVLIASRHHRLRAAHAARGEIKENAAHRNRGRHDGAEREADRRCASVEIVRRQRDQCRSQPQTDDGIAERERRGAKTAAFMR